MSRQIVVAIVGTAGRKEDGAKLGRCVFESMKMKVEDLILNKFKLKKQDVLLVSGGSAWADHIAVTLWLENILIGNPDDMYAGLRLFLPCQYDRGENQLHFQQQGTRDDPGSTLNQLHKNFSEKMGNGFNSMKDLLCAEALGAELCCTFQGFLNRNVAVAKCDYMIALTWGDSHFQPKSGGTLHTWKNCKSPNKCHIPLAELCDRDRHENDSSSKVPHQNVVGEKRKSIFK